MATASGNLTARLSDFITTSAPPAAARARAAAAFCDTAGVMLAGAVEPAARMACGVLADRQDGACHIIGTPLAAGAADAAFANGVAAHALDYDDMCFVSMAHPSCALVPAALAAGELAHATGRAALDAYVVGFELECRLGLVMNPRHYHERGWHCTSSIGTVGAAAAAARVLQLDAAHAAHAIGIAASLACGFKENLGTMVKPLHAGVAARNGVLAALLARQGFTASDQAIQGPQGYLAVMDSELPSQALAEQSADVGERWEILDTGVTVKLYPSCAATHPPLDALLGLVRQHRITADAIESIDVEVDTMTPRLLIYPRPSTGLEAKFSMPFCMAAAAVFGYPGVDTFDAAHIGDARVQALLPRVTMRIDKAFDAAANLSQARVTVALRGGRRVSEHADGARGYPGRLTDDELETKFLACAARSLAADAASDAWRAIRSIEGAADLQPVMRALTRSAGRP